MIAFAPRFRRSAAPYSALVGVFEDDALLLQLAERFRLAEPGRSRPITFRASEGFGLEGELPVDSASWDL